MAINTFSTLKSAVADWLDRSDMGEAIETMIGLCEARIYRELRISAMETAFSDTISSGAVAIPDAWLEWKEVHIASTPIQALQPKSLDWIYQTYPTRSADSKPLYIAPAGSNFVFGPYPDSDYTVAGTYYAKLTALSTSNETNWFTSYAPDLLLYGTLVHTAPYLAEDSRVALWEAGYQAAKRAIVEADDRERFSSRISMATTAA